MSADGRYRTIVADPPWTPFDGSSGYVRQSYANRKGSPQAHYPTMTLAAIMNLQPPAAEHLWLWALSRHLDWGYEVARAWGYEPIGTVTWCKPGLGVGRFQCNTEHVLLCRNGVTPFGRTSGTWFMWPRGRHSEKPAAFYDLVEQVSPGPYIELFARRQRLGWDTWGNEALEHVTLGAAGAVDE
jgi:N6-adenosine-specific RNA methylase IME4